MYIGGCSLQRHVDNLQNNNKDYSFRLFSDSGRQIMDSVSLQYALDYVHWDVVAMQQVSSESGLWETYLPTLLVLIDSVKAYQPQARLAWHQTWAYAADAQHPDYYRYYNSQSVMWDSIQVCTDRLLDLHLFDILIPSGAAIQNGRKVLGDTFCRDGYHLSYDYGRYIAACVWIEALTGMRATNKRYWIDYYGAWSSHRRVRSDKVRSARTERLCRHAAHHAILTYKVRMLD